MPSTIDEEAGLFEVSFLVRYAGQFGETDFDLRVSANSVASIRTEDRAYQVGGSSCDEEKPVVTVGAGAIAGDRCLEEMPDAVQLVSPFEVGPRGS